MAESMTSIGGYMASGYRRVAGMQLSINHLKPARIGDRIETKANPIQVGRNVQAEVEGRGVSKQRPIFCNLQLRSWTAGARGVAACSKY
ncbi:1,4-dihydroxy-2-naphthoyl-CoA thioesterase 1 isoform X2 [Aegilops tauschii subsp. strangulata]|uniref:1,4-dihydroxy-2-naphthoyl-CoA thioesterase 1 isoform X2 n=1 Tax=Aegilops tauschii subsp. strangulata TaxID=200361 RepID=UPI001E1CA19C|nr:1,4-dihydroxy-2-naphthoyl-CoA thioesterase 1-like [Aegilops tauschii subsp. strangulata]